MVLFNNNDLAGAIQTFLNTIKAYRRLKDWGIAENELNKFVKNALRTGYWLSTHPYPLKEHNILNIYKDAF